MTLRPLPTRLSELFRLRGDSRRKLAKLDIVRGPKVVWCDRGRNDMRKLVEWMTVLVSEHGIAGIHQTV